ncbi:MAG TPA: hypothetical protein PK280_00085 [Planctomycetota bacterium]|nr:hypothetical protein [Planctomycetota bacterium]
MAAMIGRGTSWLWWLAGAMCALLLGPRAGGMEVPAPVYGIRPVGEEGQVDKPDQQQKAEALLNEILAPVPAPEPPPAVKAAIEKLIRDFASEDAKVREDASAAVVKEGVPALGLLRAAFSSKDAEVAERARTAAMAIEAAAKAPKVEELKKLQPAGRQVVNQRLLAVTRAGDEAEQAAAAADKAGDAAAAEKARAAAKAAREQRAVLAALVRKVGPGEPMMMKYGVAPRLDVQ